MTKQQLRAALHSVQAGACAGCGRPITEAEIPLTDIRRLVPKSKGGTYAPENLRLTHATCRTPPVEEEL